MERFSFILAVMVLVLGSVAEAQVLPFRTYSIEKGLSESVVNGMMQDHEGYLWIATSYGLNRFDGIQFKNYYREDGLHDNKVTALFEDRDNQLWIGTESGVNLIKADSIHKPSALQALNVSTILDIYQDQLDEFWFATDGEGVWYWDGRQNVTQYREVNGLADDRVRAIVEDEQGILWFATRDGLTKLEEGNFRTYTEEDGLPDNRLRDLALTSDGELWIASRGGLCRLEDEGFRCYSEDDGLVNNRIQSISVTEADELWLGTEEGSSFFSEGTFTNYSVEEGLVNNIIQTTVYDREGNIWFGTLGGGISLFLGNQFKSYTVEEGLPNNVVTSITEDRTGNHWVATYGGGIVRIDSAGVFTTFTRADGLVDNKVYTLKSSRENELFIGTRWGLSIYDGREFRNFDEHILPYRKIRALHPLEQQEDTWWLGTYGEGILKYDGRRFQQMTEDDGLANNTVMAVEDDDDGSVWFATYGGVSRLRNGQITNYGIQDGLPNNGVLDILRDKAGNLWFATFGGIAQFQDGRFEPITGDDGLPDEVCYFIEQDDRGIFWIGTNKGLVRFDYEAYSSGQQSEEVQAFKLITQDQGLAANEMNAGASFKDSDGNLWFGSVGGVTQFDPSSEKVNRAAPKVHIEGISVSGEEIGMGSDLQVGSNNHNITFNFIGISFTAPDQVKYRYRLRNSGEGWQTTTQRSVRYPALVPGDYTFEVMAQNNDGRWSTQRASVDFTVLAPFWLRWWFILLVLFAIGGLIAFIYNYYRVKKMVDIERMRVRIASDLHDDVGSALTEIALQSDFLQTMDVADPLQDSIQQIGSQSRKIVSSLDDIVWSIDARNDTLGDLTDRMQDHVNSVLPSLQVTYRFDGDMEEKIEVSLKENLYLIFKEAINNIAKHSNAEKVQVALSIKGRHFTLNVSDNGTAARNERKSGQGLRNMKMRAKRIDADITFNSSEGFEVQVENRE
ncbi:ligand-binding sensor domain-containing protein [Fodinibius sediminis]|uniref:Ligand-binding sensor domain-containing protein n=1 Tax=Fodinibius sediminis TaxID=1214077 RepID=A0A521B8K5_9BACT|nr:sensor histidine kinase [Fodinibius sediminis]SMO43432.1 ligand-binding sensor domain-containing protein [Fodinibius sediminis]